MEELGGWSISQNLFDHVTRTVPAGGTVLELGGGKSTSAFSSLYKVITIDNDPQYIPILPGNVIIHAPLVPFKCDLFPSNTSWYDPDKIRGGLQGLDYDVIVVDGPVGGTGGRGGFSQNLDLFKTNVPIFFDDVHREAEWRLIKTVAKYLKVPYTVYDTDQRKNYGLILPSPQ